MGHHPASRPGPRAVSKAFVVAALAAAGIALGADAPRCPIDDSSMYFTGQVRVDSATGKLLQKWKCPRGHEVWVVPRT